jgi:hypothetical protein
MPIYLFGSSIVFLVWVARRRQIRALSPYGTFAGFQVLYNVMPWLAASSASGPILFGLLSDIRPINIQLTLAATSNLCFGLVYLIFYRDVRFAAPSFVSSRRVRRNYLLLTLPLFLITLALCHMYGWNQLTSAGYGAGGPQALGGMYTVTAYFKFGFVATYLYYLYRFDLDAGAWVLMGEHVIIMVVDGARTTFLPVFLVTLFLLLDKSSKKFRTTVYLLALTGFILSMATRALVFRDSGLVQDIVAPVTIEGTMGAYSSLQSIQGVERLRQPQYTFGASYVIDPFIWLIPRSIGRDGLSLDRWSDNVGSVLDDNFSPMGGFYYLSEAIAAFSYAGPAIVTTIFGFALLWVDANKNRRRMLYLAWMPSLGLMFVKVPFGNGVKLFVITLLCMQTLKMLRKLSLSLPRRGPGQKTIRSLSGPVSQPGLGERDDPA